MLQIFIEESEFSKSLVLLQEVPRGEAQELQVQCALLQALLLLMPLSPDAGASGDSRDPTTALVRTLYPTVRQVNIQRASTLAAGLIPPPPR